MTKLSKALRETTKIPGIGHTGVRIVFHRGDIVGQYNSVLKRRPLEDLGIVDSRQSDLASQYKVELVITMP